jgi:hypothetical protein
MSLFDLYDTNPAIDTERLNKLMADIVPAPSAKQTDTLIEATGKVHSGIETLAEYSKTLAILTEEMVKETRNVHQEVALLTDSSNRLEKLTVTLKSLTIWLIILAVLAVVVPVGIEIWRAVREEPVVLRPPSAPPAPTLSAH